MNICIRTDASAAIGAGHLMRCLALADALAQRGAHVAFATRAAQRPWRELIATHGHRVLALPASDADWTEDLRQTQEALSGISPVDWLIVDHYGLGREWEDAMRSHAAKLLAIDDLGRTHVSDLLLDQNVGGDHDRNGMRASSDSALLGPRYALLRPEFAQSRCTLGARDGECRRVLINFGGSDPTGETGRAIDAFLLAALPDVKAQVVLGAANPQASALRRRHGKHPGLEVIESSDRMADLMAAADIAIGAGGISTWERASLGLPSLVVTVADNQVAIAEQLGVLGSHVYLGRSGEVDIGYLAATLGVLARNRGLRTTLRRTSAALCDGLGTQRVADRLLRPTIRLRTASAADSTALHAWRNAEPIRRASSNPHSIDLATHERWLHGVLADDSRHLLIGEDAHGAVGVVRFDVAVDHAHISIYLVPERIDSGLGLPLLVAAQGWLTGHAPAVREIRARVLAENPRSAAMFAHAGYRLLEHEYRKTLETSSGQT